MQNKTLLFCLKRNRMRLGRLEKFMITYHSDLCKKSFNSLEEAKKAEDEYKKAHAAELKAMEERKAAAKHIDELRKNYIKAYNEYYKEVRNFINKYGSYHSTIATVINPFEFIKDLF